MNPVSISGVCPSCGAITQDKDGKPYCPSCQWRPDKPGQNPFVQFTLRVARVQKDGDIITNDCIHCGYPGGDIPDEGCPHGEHEFGKSYVLTPDTAWDTLTTLVGEARALTDTPQVAERGVWVEIEIPEQN